MPLTGLHLLLTYQCNYECEHCFVWGGPQQSGTMTLAQIRHILHQAAALGGVRWIYFEGGEPFLYYPPLRRGLELAHQMGFQAGLVTNAYWATSLEDATEWLRPLAGLLQDLGLSSDLYHADEQMSAQAWHAQAAAEALGIPVGVISVAQPEASAACASGKLPEGESGVMYRGRAAVKLAGRVPPRPWEGFDSCPHEDLQDPARVHVDPLGILHVCQGISIGNLFEEPLAEIWRRFDPHAHPILGPLLEGGPAGLVTRYRLPHQPGYADACHLCYQARLALRQRFPQALAPDQAYGVSAP